MPEKLQSKYGAFCCWKFIRITNLDTVHNPSFDMASYDTLAELDTWKPKIEEFIAENIDGEFPNPDTLKYLELKQVWKALPNSSEAI
ncbi:hypothetical protein FACS1894208_05030 [Clostridia bacterium]|nr:hypothetical protein FACS1894208_05030 [Clostridia bacterium]